MSSAQRVRSSLFFSVRIGTGKAFQPMVFEYRSRVSSCPHTVFTQIKCIRDAMSAMFQRGASYSAKALSEIMECFDSRPTGRYGRSSDDTFGTTIDPVSYTHLRAHETPEHLVCRLLLE